MAHGDHDRTIPTALCAVDAEGVFRDADNDRLSARKLRQIAFADLVVLNKTDLVGPQHVEVVRRVDRRQPPADRVVEAKHGDAPLDLLLGVGRCHTAQLPSGDATHARASDDFDRWSFATDRPFDIEALQEMVKRELPASVYCCKGVVRVADAVQALVLQVVGRRTSLEPLERPHSGDSRVVAIGRDMDAGELQMLFSDCLV